MDKGFSYLRSCKYSAVLAALIGVFSLAVITISTANSFAATTSSLIFNANNYNGCCIWLGQPISTPTKYGLVAEVFTDMSFTGANAFIEENTQLMEHPFQDSISSIIISEEGNQTIGYMVELCEHAGFTGSCMILGPGEYDIQALQGLNDRISSMRFLSPQSLNLMNVGLGVIYSSS